MYSFDSNEEKIINEEIEKVVSDLKYFTYGDSDDLYSHYIVCETAQSGIDLIKKLAEKIGIETD